MRNWLGQDIVPGTHVYRGARDGNSSSYKIGVVESIDPAKGTARVAWKYEPGFAYRNITGQRERVPNVPMAMDTKGSPGIDSLVEIDQHTMGKLDQAMYFIRMWEEGSLPTHKLQDTLKSILGT